MNIKEMEIAIRDLQRGLKALASRPYTQRAEDAKAEAVKAQESAEEAEKENAENLLSMVEAMLEISVEIEDTKGE